MEKFRKMIWIFFCWKLTSLYKNCKKLYNRKFAKKLSRDDSNMVNLQILKTLEQKPIFLWKIKESIRLVLIKGG